MSIRSMGRESSEEKMISVSIPQALKNMDGIFGCKVSFDCGKDGQQYFEFAKKNIIDFFGEFFCGNEEILEQKSYAMHALRHIAQGLDQDDGADFKALIKEFEGKDNLIDFRKVRTELRKIYPSKLPPVIYTRKAVVTAVVATPERRNSEGNYDLDIAIAIADADAARKLDQYFNYENVPDPVPTQNILSDFRENSLIQPSTNSSDPKKIFPKGFSNSQSEKEEFEKIYLYRVGESIRNKTYKVEIVCDADGEVSDDNLEVLAETIVAIENLTKKPIFVICDEKIIGFNVLSGRLDLAFVDAVEKLGNPYRCTQNIDTEAEIKESNELYDQSRTAPLNIALPKHIISLPIYKSK